MEASAASPLLDDRFLLLEALGRGGMARVFRAFDRSERRLVAVKVPALDLSGDAERSLAAEFEAWRRLRHPNIIQAFEMGRARRGPLPRGHPYLVLESFEGGPAHRTLSPGRVRPMDLEALARRTLAALDHVHEAGLVHRDLKPANLLVDAASRGRVRVKLTDFGLAAEIGRSGEPGLVSGSLPFIAPEALVGIAIDGRADLYGLGVLLAFLATGRMPADSRDPADVLRWHLHGPPWEESVPARAVGARLRRFVARLLERDRARRPASARDALALLGVSGAPRRSPPSCRISRSDRAALRLALDSARRGEGRTFALPRDRAAAEALVDEARTLAQIHGVHVARLGDLSSLVLDVVAACGAPSRAILARHGLLRSLPIAFVGPVPVRDRAGASDSDREAERLAAESVAAFLLDASRERPLLLVVERGAAADAHARRTVAALARALRSPSGGGGQAVLVLHPASGRARLAARSPPTSSRWSIRS
jgi:hypothetical protein